MNADEFQYALDRRGMVTLEVSSVTSDQIELDKPIQLGHLTGDVIIQAENRAKINYAGPPGRAVFEYNYTGVQEPPRIFFYDINCRHTGTGTYNTANVGFFRVVQPNTSPLSLVMSNCNCASNGVYTIDGADVSGCDFIQIKNCELSGPGMLRWRLRDAATMGWLEVYNTRYLTDDKIGPSIDLKNVRGLNLIVFTDEDNQDIMSDLNGNWGAPLATRFVNPRGFYNCEHNWYEYHGSWDTVAQGCWNTSIRCDDTTGNYGMHYVRAYQTSFRGDGTSTGNNHVKVMGGHSDTNAASLYFERLDGFSIDTSNEDAWGGKCFPKLVDGWDVADAVNTLYTDLNSTGMTRRLEVYDQDGQPRLYGNSRDPIYNTEYRLDRTSQEKDYETVFWEQSQVAYGGRNSSTAVDGSDLVITFTGSDTLVVTEEIQVEYLIAGGGGSGGAQENGTSQEGGGGGAGGFTSNFGGTKVTLAAGIYPIVVGEGGVFEWGTFGNGTDGGSSSFNGITVPGGGGGGGSEDFVTFNDGNAGGSGGGGAARGGTSGGAGSAYGYAGGSSTETAGSVSGGSGGGGAGGVGGNGTWSGVPMGGDGGPGVSNSITGTSVVYCEGGGGGSFNASNQGDGGTRGGGWPRLSNITTFERDGKKNSGCGGGGGAPLSGSAVSYPGNGGSGVVIIRVTGA